MDVARVGKGCWWAPASNGRRLRGAALAIGAALAWLVACDAARAGTGGTNCGIMYKLRDNLTIKADVSDGQLRMDKECSFRVYLHNTMSHPFWNARLEVLSDQFDVTMVPSPRWKTYPDVQSAVTDGTREYFTVTLKRKPGVPDGTYDLSLRVFTTRGDVPRFNGVVTLAEAIDQQEVPYRPGLKIDGPLRPQDWADTPTLTNFAAFSRSSADYVFRRPVDQTRVHVAADAENVWLLAMCMGVYDRSAKGNELRIYLAPQIEAKPAVLILDESTGQIASSEPVEGLRALKCPDDPDAGSNVAVYVVRIPRKALGLDKGHFCLNFCRAVAGRLPAGKTGPLSLPECSYWRGNDVSASDPVVFGRMVIHEK